MKNTSILLISILLFTIQVFSQDTISIEINLTKVQNKTCNVQVDLSNAEFNNAYLFPVSIPGTYEKRDYSSYNNSAIAISVNADTIPVKKKKNMFLLPDNRIKTLSYKSIEPMNPQGLLHPENTLFSDSIVLLNWNVLIGYFENTSNFYTIKVIKPKEFFGATSMMKKSVNDTVDIFTADSYTELIHSPVMYSKADTSSFYTKQCHIKVSCSSSSSKYNSDILKTQLKPIFEKCISYSGYIPKEYSILCVIDVSNDPNILGALEHPNSTVICLPSTLKDTTILATTVAHEFCHTLFTPLYAKSKLIEQFNYKEPLCDKHLWFYEGCVEYISRKICFQSGILDTAQYVKALHSDFLNMDNANLLKISENVYSKKGQKYFMDFYTKGSLVAFLLDLELITKSNYKMSLLGLMNKMQGYYDENGAFNEDNLFELLTQLSGVELSPFFEKYLNTTKDIEFDKSLAKINQSIETKQIEDSLIYTYSISMIRYKYLDNKKYAVLKKTDINNQLGIRKIFVAEVNNKPISYKTISELFLPKEESLELTIVEEGISRRVIVNANKKTRKMYKRIVQKLEVNDCELSKKYWEM